MGRKVLMARARGGDAAKGVVQGGGGVRQIGVLYGRCDSQQVLGR